MIVGGNSKAISSSITTAITNQKRGTFILLEGVDRCGKTTQCSLLLKHLLSLSIAAVALRFPDRTTNVGKLIDGYLRSGNDLDDRAVHLLFSANRWEVAPMLVQDLADGKTIVCDRYAYSGVAFSSAKRAEDRSGGGTSGGTSGHDLLGDLPVEWCKAPDVGLPAPDTVIFLDLSQEEALKRGGYGGERYEKRELQLRVRQRFSELQSMDEISEKVDWHVVDASQTIEEVQSEINEIVEKTMKRVQDGKPLYKMFCDGEYVLPPTSEGEGKR